MKQTVRFPKKYNKHACNAHQKLKIIRALKFWLKANSGSCTRHATMLVPTKTRTSTIFQKTNFVLLKYLREHLSIPADNGMVVAL